MYIFLYFMLYNTVFVTTPSEIFQKKFRTSPRNPEFLGTFSIYPSILTWQILSELKIKERSNFRRHEFYYKLDNYDKYHQFEKPWHSDEIKLHFISPTLRNEMKYNQSQHHQAPHHSRLEELRELIPMKIYEYVLYYQYRIREISCSEKYP